MILLHKKGAFYESAIIRIPTLFVINNPQRLKQNFNKTTQQKKM